MIPLAPVPFAAFGSLWYGGLLCGLSRALAAPWLDPWWLARGMDSQRLHAPAIVVPATRSQGSPEPAAEAPAEPCAADATIIPFDLARARVAANRAASRQEQRR